ncbi:hypothetical protein [Streptomyces sp. NPDC007346]|uniref:hypothetical protein n=1 Tax=Streptomyces sp. NPDC007346 TaxID=3154682 RepID=UPI0034520FA4
MSRDTDRLVWLFDKPYWWSREAGQLRLHPAPWALPDPEPVSWADPAGDIRQAILYDIHRMREQAGLG